MTLLTTYHNKIFFLVIIIREKVFVNFVFGSFCKQITLAGELLFDEIIPDPRSLKLIHTMR